MQLFMVCPFKNVMAILSTFLIEIHIETQVASY